MSYTMEDFLEDYVTERFKDITPEKRRKALQRLSPEERLEGLSPEVIETYLQRRREAAAASPEQSKGGQKGRKTSKR